MTYFKSCPVCNGELVDKRVEKLLKGGGDTVAIKVTAQACLSCGERLYGANVVRTFDKVRDKLRNRIIKYTAVS